MRLLQERASYNDVSLKKVTLARMNALAIPLADESVDTVVANGVLHLISNPEKVIKEIWRVLKRGGAYLCLDDRPGQNVTTPFDNSHYFEIVNYLYQEYWKIINQKGITPQKYSWKFDRNVTCDQIFQSKTEKIIERNQPYEISLDEGFLPRLMGKGFSDQVSVPNDIHQESVEKVLNQAKEKFGVDFGKVTFKGIEDNLIVTIFIK